MLSVLCPLLRYSNNLDWMNPHYSSMMALTHFTHHHTDGRLMLVDLQGVGYLLTDPQIHCDRAKQPPALHGGDDGSSSSSFGVGDLGVEGMDAFFSMHHCNAVCQRLQLPPHVPPPKQPLNPDEAPDTVAADTYTSQVIGLCGHVVELQPRARANWLVRRQEVQCPGCKTPFFPTRLPREVE